MFSYPARLDHSAVSQLENRIIEICSTATNLEEIESASSPIWNWACNVLHKTRQELRLEIESHEADECFPNQFLEEKDHLLKLPLILLEKLNS